MNSKARHFLTASEAMMVAFDAADGMSARHLECFQHNFMQLTGKMIEDARARELREDLAKLYPMDRKDWGKGEKPVSKEVSHD